jgi:hypothetical protein
MVRPEGFEPPTNGFGSHYSIRLSYGRIVIVKRRQGPVGRRRKRSVAEMGGVAYLLFPSPGGRRCPQGG